MKNLRHKQIKTFCGFIEISKEIERNDVNLDAYLMGEVLIDLLVRLPEPFLLCLLWNL